MNRNVLLIVAAIAVVAACARREEAVSAPETDASPPTVATEPAPAETLPSAPDVASTPDASVAEETASETNGCNAEAVQHLVGEIYTPEAGEQARVAAGASVERALRPGQIVTMEFRADRLSFTLDEKGRISRASCG